MVDESPKAKLWLLKLVSGLLMALVLVIPVAQASEASAAAVWSATTAPLSNLNPSAYSANPNVIIRAVTCPGSGTCVAVGSYSASSAEQNGVNESLANGSWNASTIPTGSLSPATNAINASMNPLAISCPASGTCVAVGTYADSSGHSQGFTELLSGGSWTSSTVPLPASAATNPVVNLGAISCPASGTCVAVGKYYDQTDSSNEGLIETLSGGSWSALTAPLGGLSPAAGSNANVNLQALSCPASGTCFATGSYRDGSGNQQGLIETLSGGSWSALAAPLTGLSANSNPEVYLEAISCPGSGKCFATGTYLDSSGYQQGLIETLANGSWSALTAPLTGLNPAAGTDPYSVLSAVSCAGTGSCVAVGGYTDVNAKAQGLIETLANGSWSALTAPLGANPSSAAPNANLYSVSCPLASSCVAVGTYDDTSSNRQGLIDSLAASGSWTGMAAPTSGLSPSPGANAAVKLRNVACADSSSCVTVGNYDDVSGLQQGLIEFSAASVAPSPSPVSSPSPVATETLVTVTPVSAVSGTAVTLSATVSSSSGVPFGSVIFKIGSMTLCTTNLADGVATCTVANAPVGSDSITATYPGAGNYQSSSASAVLTVVPGSGHDYWLVAKDGGVFSFGDAIFYGSMGGKSLAQPIVGITSTPDGKGYWLVAKDGGVFSFGDAIFYGSMGGKSLAQPIVGITSTPDGKGYWLVAKDGGVFSFGDAIFYGSMGGKSLAQPIVGITSTPDGKGYWLVAKDGGVFSFGDAIFYGSMGGKSLAQPIVGITSTPDGKGYWLVAKDGGVFSFGDAIFYGSMGGKSLAQPIVGITSTPDGKGYWLVAKDGGVFSFGDAIFYGSMGGKSLAQPIVGVGSALGI